MSDNVIELYQLEGCFQWVLEQKFKRVAIQLRSQHLKRAVDINNFFRDRAKNSKIYEESPLEIFVSRSNTCCVDLLVTQHVPELDGIIHFGDVCLSKSEICNHHIDIPILFAFEVKDPERPEIRTRISHLVKELRTITQTNKNSLICLLTDTSNIDYASQVAKSITQIEGHERIHMARLSLAHHNWSTLTRHQAMVTKIAPSCNLFGPHVLVRDIKEYNVVIHLGTKLSTQLSLQCSSHCYTTDLSTEGGLEPINTTKLLNRRVALVSRLKDEVELKIGVIITNPLPNIRELAGRLERYAKARSHTLYFISMVQTIDECKMGNFDLCDAFVVANSCTCSTVLESLVFNRPIISEIEFRLACGFESEYGGIVWPGSSSHLSEDDLENRRKVSDVSLALIQTRNELLERCSQARANKWSGLEFKPATTKGDQATSESLDIQDGLVGIASSYSTEPLERTNQEHEDKQVIVSIEDIGLSAAMDAITIVPSNVRGDLSSKDDNKPRS